MANKELKTSNEKENLALERVVFFTDAVFAIAITLLLLEIRLPDLQGLVSNESLLKTLTGLWQKYLAYAVSFLVIGSFWISHHRKFQYIVRVDSNLIYLNLFLLLTIAFIPFPTSVLSEYGNRTATIFYAGVMVFAGLLSAMLWIYAQKHNRLIEPSTTALQRKKELWTPLLMSTIFLLSIGVSFLNEDVAKAVWGLIAFIPPLFQEKVQPGRRTLNE